MQASELAARMNAMQSANDNAKELKKVSGAGGGARGKGKTAGGGYLALP